MVLSDNIKTISVKLEINPLMAALHSRFDDITNIVELQCHTNKKNWTLGKISVFEQLKF